MNSRKEIALGKVNRDFEKMANLVLSQLDTVQKLLDSDELSMMDQEAKEFYKVEKKLDKLEVKLSDRIVNTIVLFQPVAGEIRQIISAYRIVLSLERIGDHALKVVAFMSDIKSLKVYNELSDHLSNILTISTHLLKKALSSYIQQDKESAIEVMKDRDEGESLNQKSLKKIIEKSKEFEEKKKVILSFITIKEMIDNIERMADHAVNIAEASIYFLEGKDLRHQPFFDED